MRKFNSDAWLWRAYCCFNVAASIKMRKCAIRKTSNVWTETGFNVAASIKMRKSEIQKSPEKIKILWLQCGRIYKDAEIDAEAVWANQNEDASMWPHL